MNVRKSSRLALLVGAVLGVVGGVFAVPADDGKIYGTLVWQGAASGGDWNDAANWRAVDAGENTAADLLTKNCVYDLSALADGAELVNRTPDLKVAGIVTSSDAQGEITCSGEPTLLTGMTIFQINNAETRIVWKLDHDNNWNSKDGQQKILLLGSGTLRLEPPKVIAFYRREFQPCNSTTLELTRNCNFKLTHVVQWNASTVRLLDDVTIGNLVAWQTESKLDLNGHTLYLCGGESDWDNWTYTGPVSGAGSIVLFGGDDMTWSSLLGFTGNFTLYTGRLLFPDGAFPSTVHPVVNGPNCIVFNSSQTLCRISGDGVAGGIRMPDEEGSTLTLTGTGAEKETTTYNARLHGRDVVKRGADYELVLTGDNDYAGTTTVAEGTLRLRRAFCRPGLVACWTFDDPENLGRDYGPAGADLSPRTVGAGVVASSEDGLGGSGALRLGFVEGEDATHASGRMERAGCSRYQDFPLQNDPLSVTLWLKPQAGNPTCAYIFKLGNWASNGGQVRLWQMGDNQLEWIIDNWITEDSPNSPIFDCPGLCDGTWHQVAVTYEDCALKVYYDGKLASEKTTTHPLNLGTYTLSLGNDDDGAPKDHRFHGELDDVCVWRRALTAEEIAEEYAQTRAPVADAAAQLPAPVCRWSFDDTANPGLDTMGAADLVQNPLCANGPKLDVVFDGCFGGNLSNGSSMILPAADQPARFPVGASSFTVSLRFMPGVPEEWRDLCRFGGSNAGTADGADYFTFSYGECPRRLFLTCGNVRTAFFWSNTGTSKEGGWTHVVASVDALRRVMRIFRDGILEQTLYDIKLNLAAGDLILNASPGIVQTTGCRIDDLRIFDVALTAEEVRTLTRSLATGTVGPVLPATSPVVVAAGARLAAEGEQHRVKAVSGAGEVNVVGRLLVEDWTGFTGTVTGLGRLVVAKSGVSKIGDVPSVAANVVFEDDTVALSAANVQRPAVRTTGHVTIPANATLKLVDEGATVGKWLGKTFQVAACASCDCPATTAGMTFSPDDGRGLEGKFVHQDGVLLLKMKGAGSVLLLR